MSAESGKGGNMGESEMPDICFATSQSSPLPHNTKRPVQCNATQWAYAPLSIIIIIFGRRCIVIHAPHCASLLPTPKHWHQQALASLMEFAESTLSLSLLVLEK